jgi:predicted ester cyclase
MESPEMLKEVVLRFNREVIDEGNLKSFDELMHTDFYNHTAPPGGDTGKEGILNSIHKGLRVAFPDIKVIVHDIMADGDKVAARKSIHGTHLGIFMGIPPTGKKISIEVMEFVKIKDGQYLEYWGLNSLHNVIAELKTQSD